MVSSKRLLLLFTIIFACLFLVFIGSRAQAQFQTRPKIQKILREITRRPFRSACNLPGNHFAHCHAKVTTLDDAVTPLAGAIPFASSITPAGFHIGYQLPCTPSGSVSSNCATPSSFGPIVAIVDAFHAPNIENDLNVYSNYFGIPPCTKANGCLVVANQNGGSNLPSTVNSGWAMETSLDVEVAHAICQTCKILLVEANSNLFSDLGTAVITAANLGAVAISNSYGAPEWNNERNYDFYYNHPGIAVTVSSGDSGYETEYPASSPYVIGVGGTTLQLFTDLTYSSEAVWSGAGSGCSGFESTNSWQSFLSNWSLTGCGTARAVSDVSAVADPNTGAAVYDTTPYNGQTGWWQIGGTSLSAPLIAAAFAMGAPIPPNTNAASILYSNYSLLNFHDITSGSNGSCGTVMCIGVQGFDGPTGLGTPNGLGGFGATQTATSTPTLTPTATPTLTLTPTITPTPGDTQPPTVSITNPKNGARVSRNTTITIRASASDNAKVQKVEFYINGGLLRTDTVSPYNSSWRVPSPRNITYTITAKAYDTSNNFAQASISVTSR